MLTGERATKAPGSTVRPGSGCIRPLSVGQTGPLRLPYRTHLRLARVELPEQG